MLMKSFIGVERVFDSELNDPVFNANDTMESNTVILDTGPSDNQDSNLGELFLADTREFDPTSVLEPDNTLT
jgi:hypothetical protein